VGVHEPCAWYFEDHAAIEGLDMSGVEEADAMVGVGAGCGGDVGGEAVHGAEAGEEAKFEGHVGVEQEQGEDEDGGGYGPVPGLSPEGSCGGLGERPQDGADKEAQEEYDGEYEPEEEAEDVEGHVATGGAGGKAGGEHGQEAGGGEGPADGAHEPAPPEGLGAEGGIGEDRRGGRKGHVRLLDGALAEGDGFG